MAALATADILTKYSVTSGAAGNSTAGAMASSWGKYLSTTTITDNTLNNLFPDFSAAENAALTAKYVCIFLHNSNGSSNAWNTVQVYLTQPAGLALACSVDTTGATVIASASAQAKTIASVTTAPATQTFTAPTVGSPLTVISSLPAGQCIALWVRLTGTSGNAVFPDTEVLNFTGTT